MQFNVSDACDALEVSLKRKCWITHWLDTVYSISGPLPQAIPQLSGAGWAGPQAAGAPRLLTSRILDEFPRSSARM